MDKALHTTHGRTTSHGLPHVKQNLHATAGQSHSGTTGRTVGRGKDSLSPSPSPKGRGVITISRAASLSLATPTFPCFPSLPPPSLAFPLFPSLPLALPLALHLDSSLFTLHLDSSLFTLHSSLRLFTLHLDSSLTYEIKEKEEKSGANLPYRPSDHARLYNFANVIQRAISYRQSSWWISISDNRHELTRLLERRHENARNAENG